MLLIMILLMILGEIDASDEDQERDQEPEHEKMAVIDRRYRSNSPCFTVPTFAASSRTSGTSDLNSHFSSAAISAG